MKQWNTWYFQFRGQPLFCYNFLMDITNKHGIRYPVHIFKEFSKIYSSLGIKNIDAEKILCLYKLHNKIANHILSYCFQVEEQLKSDLIEYLSSSNYKDVNDLKNKFNNKKLWNRIPSIQIQKIKK